MALRGFLELLTFQSLECDGGKYTGEYSELFLQLQTPFILP